MLLAALLLTFHLPLFTSPAAPPDRREIWIPTAELKSVLEKNPRAVLLTRDQYDTLLRDAAVKPADPVPPPIPALVSAANFTAVPEGQTLRVTGELTIEVLTDNWATVPLQLNENQISSLQFDGSTAIRNPEVRMEKGVFTIIPNDPQNSTLSFRVKDGMVQGVSGGKAPTETQLIVRGKGRHTVGIELMQPISTHDGQSVSNFSLPATSAGRLRLILPAAATANAMVVQPFPDRTELLHAFSGPAQTFSAKWQPADPSGGVPGSLSQTCNVLYRIDSARIQSDFDFTIAAAMGKLPATLRLPIPADCKIAEVLGDEIASWTIEKAVLTIQLFPTKKASITFRVTAQVDSPPLPTSVAPSPSIITPITSSIINQPIFSTRPDWTKLPFLTVENARRVSGRFQLFGSDDTAIRNVYPGASSRPDANNSVLRKHFAGAWNFDTVPDFINVQLVRLNPKFDADLDTAINFQPDGIHLRRTITLHERDGQIFALQLQLPPGEQLIGIKDAANTECDYRQEGEKVIVTLGKSRVLTLETRLEPTDWPTLPATGYNFSLAALGVESAGKINGYLAVSADPSFLVETVTDEGLEPRDGRITPVKGDFAWFGRGRDAAAKLHLRVTRRPAEINAQIAGYVLPAANTLEINARIDFQIAHSGVRTLRVKIPGAENFHLEGPGIAERTFGGEAKDTWTVTFQKEQTGSYGLQVTGQIPITRDAEKAERFHVTVPTIEPLDAARFGSTWAVEANTDTEIRFDASGLNEIDNLRAPSVAGYTPRHRVIGVFSSLGSGGTLTLRGERHRAATIPAIIVDRLELTSILSTGGKTRHQATLIARNAGEQFLEMRLPAGTKLWSTTVDGQPVKPVQNGKDAVRIALPQQDSATPIRVGLVYETGGREWKGSGSLDLLAPKLDDGLPILQSQWTVWLPDGHSYEKLTSNLQHAQEPAEDLLLTRLAKLFPALTGRKVLFAGISDPSGEMTSTERGQLVSSLSSDDSEREAITRKLNTIIIPRIEFRDATLREAIDYLYYKGRDLDTDKAVPSVKFRLEFPSVQQSSIEQRGPAIPGLDSAPTPIEHPGDTPITLSLQNVPLIEALKYITTLSNVKFKIEPDGVSIIPLSESADVLITKSYPLREGFKGRMPLQDYLENKGVVFPPGSSAVFDDGNLMLKNTQENLDLVDALTDEDSLLFSHNRPAKTAGLLPLTLDLKPVGKSVVFTAAYAAETVHITHLDWWSRGQRMWIWLVLGGAAFVVLGRRRPFLALLWGTLIFTFIPVCLIRAWTLENNGLLAGWIAAFGGVLVYRWCRADNRQPHAAMESETT